MTSVALYRLISGFFLLTVSQFTDCYYEPQREMANSTDKCEPQSCGPPISIKFQPNPPRLNTDCAVYIVFKLVEDYFDGSFLYDVVSDNGFRLHGELNAKPSRPYHKGETLTKNYTFNLPPYVEGGIAFRFNVSLKNDEDQPLCCVYGHCAFAPEHGD